MSIRHIVCYVLNDQIWQPTLSMHLGSGVVIDSGSMSL